MSFTEIVNRHFAESIQVQQECILLLSDLIEHASRRLVTALLNDNKFLVCGNGSSAANVQIFCANMLNRFERERPSLPAIALGNNISAITSIANDYHFDDIFAKQIRALGQSGDVLMIFTTSGNPANILKAVTAAHDKDCTMIAMTGQSGGMLAPILDNSDIEIRVPSHNKARILETHLLISHCLCDLIDQQLFGG